MLYCFVAWVGWRIRFSTWEVFHVPDELVGKLHALPIVEEHYYIENRTRASRGRRSGNLRTSGGRRRSHRDRRRN